MLYPVELRALERPTGFEPATHGLEGRYSTVELQPHLENMVGATGFEPASSGAQDRRAPNLRYAPYSTLTKYILSQLTGFVNIKFFQNSLVYVTCKAFYLLTEFFFLRLLPYVKILQN